MPKKGKNNDINSNMQADIQEIKKTLSFLTKETMDVKSLITEIKELKRIIQEKDKVIKNFEVRVEELEQYSKQDNVIINGLKIEKNKGDADIQNSVEDQVLETLASKDIMVNKNNISACHTIGKARNDGTQSIVLRFVKRKEKTNLLFCARKLKGTGIYINEHLTKTNSYMYKMARDLKKNGKIDSTWTRDCKIYIKNTRGQILLIKEKSDLDSF